MRRLLRFLAWPAVALWRLVEEELKKEEQYLATLLPEEKVRYWEQVDESTRSMNDLF